MDAPNTSEVTAADICDALGRKAMAVRLRVKSTAVSNAATDGRFPSRWLKIVRSMCEEIAIPCPESLFNFIEAELPSADGGASASPPPAEDAA